MERFNCYKDAGSGRKYQIVGLKGTDIVLMPMDEDDDQVRIYTRSEMKELVGKGSFRKLLEVDEASKSTEDNDHDGN